jgi:2-polyprenyl-3-methyl-5-hydroxy-6-metoxy-1,4-benzoquinol methylase
LTAARRDAYTARLAVARGARGLFLATLHGRAEAGMGDTPKLDTQLVEALNREYRLTPTVPAPAGLGREDRGARAAHVAARLDRLVGLRGRTILEIGCGAGDLAFELAGNYGAYVTGIDIGEREDWKTLRHPNLTLSAHDVTAGECALPENGFDRIISRAVWEHIRHPFAALVQCRRLLCPAGKKYL